MDIFIEMQIGTTTWWEGDLFTKMSDSRMNKEIMFLKWSLLEDEDGYEPRGEVSMYPRMSDEGIFREILNGW